MTVSGAVDNFGNARSFGLLVCPFTPKTGREWEPECAGSLHGPSE